MLEIGRTGRSSDILKIQLRAHRENNTDMYMYSTAPMLYSSAKISSVSCSRSATASVYEFIHTYQALRTELEAATPLAASKQR